MSQEKKLIALYLPQFHPTERNNKWWGKGFTEWTNVGKAKPLYPGHYQPHVPADLGYYDLRLPEVRKAQAEMAKEYGVYGFCYYHYWFEKGVEELETPLDEVIRLGEPDFPFCICWANESWSCKFWNFDGSIDKKILAEQKYLGAEDNEAHFYRLLPAFQDERYIRIDGKLLFVIYMPLQFENFALFKTLWNELAQKNGLPTFYFVCYTGNAVGQVENIRRLGFEKIISCNLDCNMSSTEIWIRNHIRKYFRIPDIRDYAKYYKRLSGPYDKDEDIIPTIVPNWDHTPRSGVGGVVFKNSTPENFEKHVSYITSIIDKKHNKLCFLKSWNEWGEGNYVEPDLKYGLGYLEVIKKYFK